MQLRRYKNQIVTPKHTHKMHIYLWSTILYSHSAAVVTEIIIIREGAKTNLLRPEQVIGTLV